MGWMMVFWVVLIVAVPTVLWFFLSEKRGDDGERKDPAENDLMRRYTKGVIDREEYERRLVHHRR